LIEDESQVEEEARSALETKEAQDSSSQVCAAVTDHECCNPNIAAASNRCQSLHLSTPLDKRQQLNLKHSTNLIQCALKTDQV